MPKLQINKFTKLALRVIKDNKAYKYTIRNNETIMSKLNDKPIPFNLYVIMCYINVLMEQNTPMQLSKKIEKEYKTQAIKYIMPLIYDKLDKTLSRFKMDVFHKDKLKINILFYLQTLNQTENLLEVTNIISKIKKLENQTTHPQVITELITYLETADFSKLIE